MTANLQLSTKLPDGKIFVVGGENFDDYYANLIALYGGSVEHADVIIAKMQESLMPTTEAAVVAATNVVQGAFPQAAPVQPQAPQPQQYQQQAAPQRPAGGPPPGQTAPVCEHGYAREWKTGGGPGTGKKAWKAWMCPLSRDEGACAPQWVR